MEKAIQKGQEMLSQEADQRSALEQEQARLAEQRSQLKISMMELEKDMDTLSREIQQQSDQQDSMVEKLAQTGWIFPPRKNSSGRNRTRSPVETRLWNR